ncbi:MAG: hypothetical protein JW878_05045 [Methanomicrobia archaeon]|nr:hypothetical protein [Methanomicrobia archaeon]
MVKRAKNRFISGAVVIVVIPLSEFERSIACLPNNFQRKSKHSSRIPKTSISDTAFSYEQLNELPEPVQRYFKRSLKAEQPYISYARFRVTEIEFNKPERFE